MEFTTLRVVVGYLVAVIVALAVHNLPMWAVVPKRGLCRSSCRAYRSRTRTGSLFGLGAPRMWR